MGRKMGINSKAVEARERKEAQKNAKKEATERQKEDQYWQDNDKHVNRKLDRQKERETKLQEERDRKLANKAAYERDMEIAESSAKAKSSKQGGGKTLEAPEKKVTRHDIAKSLEHEGSSNAKQIRKVNVEPLVLVPNLNRLDDGENASTVDQALDLLRGTK